MPNPKSKRSRPFIAHLFPRNFGHHFSSESLATMLAADRQPRQELRLTKTGQRIHNVCVRIIKESFLWDAAETYPKTTKYLAAWMVTVKAASWRSLTELQRAYPSADQIKVASGKPVVVFNVCGNSYRLIVALHFDRQLAYILRFLTHADYSKDRWKDEL